MWTIVPRFVRMRLLPVSAQVSSHAMYHDTSTKPGNIWSGILRPLVDVRATFVDLQVQHEGPCPRILEAGDNYR